MDKVENQNTGFAGKQFKGKCTLRTGTDTRLTHFPENITIKTWICNQGKIRISVIVMFHYIELWIP